MRRFRRLALLFSLFTAFSFSLSAEDLTVVSKVSVGGKSTTQTQYMTSKKTRSSDGDNDSIIEFATGRFVFIEHKKKEYWETSVQEMSAFFDKLEKDMRGNPMLESMFGGPDDVEVKKGNKSRKVAGYDCDEYTMSMGSSLVFDFCAAKGLQPPAQYFEGRKFSYAAMGPMGKRYAKMFEEMKKIPGFPLALEIDMDMGMAKQSIVTEATEVKKGPIPDSTFDLPAGYRKKASPFKA